MCETDMAKASENNSDNSRNLSPKVKRNNRMSPRSKRAEMEPCTTVTISKELTAETNTARQQQFQKTKPCRFYPLGACSKNEQCPFAHERQEIRPLPNLGRTKMCPTLIQTKGCNQPNCTYAHTKAELRSTTAFLKTKICKFYEDSNIAYGKTCPMGDTCRFAHSEAELRQNLESLKIASGAEYDDFEGYYASPSPATSNAYNHKPVVLHLSRPDTNASPTSAVEYYSTYEEPSEISLSDRLEEREPLYKKQANRKNRNKTNMLGEEAPTVSINILPAPDNYYVRSMTLGQSTEQLQEWSDARANQAPRISTLHAGLRQPFLSTCHSTFRGSLITANSYDEPLFITLGECEENGRLVERASIHVSSPELENAEDIGSAAPRISGLVMTNKNTFLDFSQGPASGVNELLLRSPRAAYCAQSLLPVFSSHL